MRKTLLTLLISCLSATSLLSQGSDINPNDNSIRNESILQNSFSGRRVPVYSDRNSNIPAYVMYQSNPNSDGEYVHLSGRLTEEDFATPRSLAAKNVPAYVISEEGLYYFGEEDDPSQFSPREISLRGTKLSFNKEVYTKIHIVKQSGIEYATFKIPFHSSTGVTNKIAAVEGYTYNIDSDGIIQSTKLEKTDIIEEKSADGTRIMKVVMPDVHEGSIVELYYGVKSDDLNMPVWEFQKKIPVLYSRLSYKETPSRRYVLIPKGIDNIDDYKVEEQHSVVDGAGYSSTQTLKTHIFAMRNLKAIEDVDMLRNPADYHVSLHPHLAMEADQSLRSVQNHLSSTWSALKKDFLSDSKFGGYVKSATKEAKKMLAGLDIANSNGVEKIKSIVNYVRGNYNWNGNNGRHAEKKLSTFLKEKTGNVANLNLFLAGMLQAAGIESYPVILRTKPAGMINKRYPFKEMFDFVVVQAKTGEKTYYLDATDTFTPFDMVSENSINTEGLIMNPKVEEWILITDAHPSVNFATVNLTPDPKTGILSGEVVRSYSGLSGVNHRKLYGGKQGNVEKLINDGREFTLKGGEVANYDNVEVPMIVKYGFETELNKPQTDKIFIEPLIFLAPKDNMFKQPVRHYPIDLISRNIYSYTVSLAIPEGYELEHLPVSQRVDNPEISMVYSTAVDGNVVTVNAQFSFKKAEYPYSDYGLLRKYYGDMVTKFSENIILTRK